MFPYFFWFYPPVLPPPPMYIPYQEPKEIIVIPWNGPFRKEIKELEV